MSKKKIENVRINDFEIPKELQNRRRILITVHESDHSIKTLSFVKEHILKKDDFVMLLMAMKRTIIPYLLTVDALKTIEDEELKREAFDMSNYLDHFDQYEKMGYLVQGENPRDTLVKAIEELKPTIIATGSHGKGVFKRLFSGSTSEYLLHHAKIPIMIVK
ncbi:hypothetical protein MHBO_002822 [Bonamia ostreae]|uniref:UspA domain-containing protein n=1 Tax=Bonamia ostreae TaxID=126728 RepID=A0ABV2AP76_9EUKA